MEDTAKYLIHADVTANGVVERSDVVGAVFGQTEGLLGTEMDLRKLQEASKVGRIDVDVDSERGHSFGELTIASSLDRVETAVLAASLETISRIGPCRAEVQVTGIEDVRAAKRRDVVDRAKELMAESFDDSVMSTQEILAEVRRSVRVEDITEYEGLPAGPHVTDSDAIIVVEGRADVIQLLQYGIKNAVAVEGTNVPEAVGDLTSDRTVTAFFDGDRGGDLILKELAQVGDVDYVALAPAGRSVEDLSRREVTEALREKMPYEVIAKGEGSVAATDGSVRPAPDGEPSAVERPASSQTGDEATDSTREDATVDDASPSDEAADGPERDPAAGSDPSTSTASGTSDATDPTAGDTPADAPAPGETGEGTVGDREDGPTGDPAAGSANDSATGGDADPSAGQEEESGQATDDELGAGTGDESASGESDEAAGTTGDGRPEASTLVDHARAVIGPGAGAGSDDDRGATGDQEAERDGGTVRLLDESCEVLAEQPAADAFEAIEGAETAPWAVVLDGVLTQRVLDVVAQRGVAQVIARETGDLVKRPTSVRIRTADQLLEPAAG